MSEICCKGTGAPETRCEYDDADVEVIGNVFDDKYLLDETECCREQEKGTEDSYGK